MASKPPIRLKVVKMVEARGHRYPWSRLLSQAFTLGVLLGVPLSGLARVDFWRGEHRLLFKEAALRPALAGVIIGIAAIYVITFLSNVVAGRLFCGWGCPVAQVNRFYESTQLPGLKGWRILLAHLPGALYSVALGVSIIAWWVDLRILAMGSGRELAVAWGLVGAGILSAYGHGRWWRWEFCKTACPVGLYYSFVSPARYFGIYFRNQKSTCIECDACDNVCPVNLHPRDLAAAAPDRGGLSLTDAPGFNHCIECGDCVRACERMIELKTPEHFPDGVPLLMGYFSGPQRVDAPAEPSGKELTVKG